MFSFSAVPSKCGTFKSNSYNASRFRPRLWPGVSKARGREGNASLAASASKQTWTEGFEEPRVLRDLGKRFPNPRRSILSALKIVSPYCEKKRQDCMIMQKRGLFSIRFARLKRRGIFVENIRWKDKRVTSVPFLLFLCRNRNQDCNVSFWETLGI